MSYYDPERIESILKSLISGYIDDISRHAKGKARENGEHVWSSIPSQLARNNNRFVQGHVKDSVRARDLWSSIDWLSGAGLVHLVPICSGKENVPPLVSDRSVFKLYCFYTGIPGSSCWPGYYSVE